MVAAPARWVVLVWVIALGDGCGRRETRGGADAGAEAGTATEAGVVGTDAGTDPGTGGEEREPPPGGEAHRSVVSAAQDDPLLRPYADAVRARFGDARGLAMQHVPLAGGKSGVLLETADERIAMVLAIDGGRLAWSKERPTAGMIPPARELALAPHPMGGATLFAYDEPTRRVAARMWSDDGSPFADFEVMELDGCAALSAAYWPGRGWLVAGSAPDGPRAALLREDGTRAWGQAGIVIGFPWKTPSPVSIVVDTAASVVLVQRAPAPDGAGDHALASRYGASGRPLWDRPVDLGEMRAPDAKTRIFASRAREGVVRVKLPRELGKPRVVEVNADGVIVR